MNGKVVIVTGASSGIGAAIAQKFEKSGALVVGTSRSDPRFAKLDVDDPDSCTDLVSQVMGEHGRTDVLVNNAGFAQMGAFEDFSEDDVLAAFQTNVFGAMRMARLVLPQMQTQRSGRIINICSVTSFLPAPYMGVYSSTKHALEGFSLSLDHELRGSGVRSIAVRPGFMKSSIGENTSFAQSAEGKGNAAAVKASVEKSLSSADDPAVVADLVVSLASDDSPPAVANAGREARTLGRLHQLLPTAIFDKAFRKQFGLVD